MFGPAIDTAAARILAGPLTHIYAALWRAGILTTTDDEETQCSWLTTKSA